MSKNNLQERLNRALDHSTPDVWDNIQSACDNAKGAVIPMTEQTPKTGKKRIWTAIAAAAAVLVLAVGIGGGYHIYAERRVDSLVELDVNPSLEMKLNRDDKVLEARALNDDAQQILDGMDLKGTDWNVAVNALIGSLVKHGYIDELSNSVLITVENDDPAKQDDLNRRLTEEISRLLSSRSVDGAILSQSLTADDTLRKLADDHHISTGKAALIQEVIALHPTLTFEELAARSINELNLLKGDKAESTGIISTGTASDKAYIGTKKALEAAKKHAGITDIAHADVEMDWEDGRMVYEVEFIAGNTEYDTDIDALTGAVLKQKKEPVDNDDDDDDRLSSVTGQTSTSNTPVATSSAGVPSTARSLISSAKAGQSALSHAGLTQQQVSGLRIELDHDDGMYEVSFRTADAKYEYDINAYSAAVTGFEKETLRSAAEATGAAAFLAPEKARDIALRHAGVTIAQAADLEVELEKDDQEYEVSFHAGGQEFEYNIGARSGTILKYSSEPDD